MAGNTTDYGLQTVTQNDSLYVNGNKFTDADRHTIARLLKVGAETHRHTGVSGSSTLPSQPVGLVLASTGGTLGPGQRYYYKYTLVDVNGGESTPSPQAYIDTPAQVADPAAPSLTGATTGGTLAAGTYYYVLSAYKDSTTAETFALNSASITLGSGSTNTITLTMPALPAGATGFNIYRKRPGTFKYVFLASTSATSYVDNGSVAEDAARGTPTANTTNAQNKVTVTLPGGTVPAGYTWKLYRSTQSEVYNNALLASIASGASYTDTGATTSSGSPPTASSIVAIGSPSKVILTAAEEVQGTLPAANIDQAALATALQPLLPGGRASLVTQVVASNVAVDVGILSVTVAAGSFTVGRVYRFVAYGNLDHTTGSPVLNLWLKVGSTKVVNIPMTLAATVQTGKAWRAQFVLTCRSIGATGTVVGAGDAWDEASAVTRAAVNTGTSVVDTTVSQTLALGFNWQAADVANIGRADHAVAELVKL